MPRLSPVLLASLVLLPFGDLPAQEAAAEQQKNGCEAHEVPALAQMIEGLPAVELRGLMTMAPFTDDERVQRQTFRALRRLREDVQASGYELHELSMGMSGDYRAAVAEGATMLRLGTVLFGERPR